MPIKTGRRKQPPPPSGASLPAEHLHGSHPLNVHPHDGAVGTPNSAPSTPLTPPHMQGGGGMPLTPPMGMQHHHPPHPHMGYFSPGPPPGPGPMPMHGPMNGPMNPNFFRRHTPYFGQPDYRLYELNKRLQQRTEDSDNLWWDAFATEFFEDDATLTLTFCLEDGPKRYTIGRTLLPRYFRSIFEGGVTELYYAVKHPKESFHNTSITLDCDQCTMVTHHGKPMYTKVFTDGRLILEFTFDDLMRIKSWHFAVRSHQELVPRNVIAMQQDPSLVETLSKNITRQGITSHTLNYLRLCVILEPMQELMSRHKAYALSPRDCLKTTLFQKWQRMVAPPETQRAPNKRRKRKGSQSGQNANANSTSAGKKRSPGPNFNLASQVSDVMVVGEPSLMGGEFGDEDERLITRLENSQYDTSAAQGGGVVDDPTTSSSQPPPSANAPPNPGGPQQPPPTSNNNGGPNAPSGAPYTSSPHHMGPGGPGPWGDPSRPPNNQGPDPDKKSPALN